MKLENVEKLENVKKDCHYCSICRRNTDHRGRFNCPNRSKGMGMGCDTCFEPCEIKGHNLIPMYKICLRCELEGDHWSKDCPNPIYDDDDMFY